MDRFTTALVNWIVGFVIAYLVARPFGGRSTALKAGIASGSVSALVGVLVSERFRDRIPADDGGVGEVDGTEAQTVDVPVVD